MDDTGQIEPPPSFTALYMAADGARLARPAAYVIERYELCEDLAQSLTEQAATLLFKSDESEGKVLERVREGLAAGDAVTPREADWIVMRLAELAGWAGLKPAQ